MAKYPEGKRRAIGPKFRVKKTAKEDPSTYLLRTLLAASPYFVSGSILADRLKMTRVAVWGRIDKLRSEGIEIEAARNRGYRLEAEPDRLNKHLLEAWMRERRTSCAVSVFDSLDSTNSEAERQLATGRETPFAILANSQEKGRGRLGRRWHSPPAGNVYLSTAFRPEVPAFKLQLLTLWLGIRLCRLLRSETGSELMVKWPNDLVSGDRKTGGILTEASIDPERVLTLTFGLGLNVNSTPNRFTKDLKKIANSLRNETGQTFRLHELTAKIIECILLGYDECLQGIDSRKLQREWEYLDALSGRDVRIELGKESIQGKVLGINNTGALKLKLRNGRTRTLCSGDVTLLKKND